MIRRRNYIKRGVPTTGESRITRKRNGPKHRIILYENSEGWAWTYFVGAVPKARSARYYSRLSDVSYSARLFRGLLANADVCEIYPPENHEYSGG